MKVKAYAARTGLQCPWTLTASLLLFSSMDDGWDASREPPLVLQVYFPRHDRLGSRIQVQMLPRSSWAIRKYEQQLSARPAGTPLVIGPLDVPAPLDRVVPEVIHPVQCGIIRAQTTKSSLVMTKTSRPYETDILLGRISDRDSKLVRHLVSAGSAMPVLRDAHDRRHSCTQAGVSLRQQRAQPFTRVDTLQHPERRSSTSSTSASRITFALPTTLALLSWPTRTLFTRTSKSRPFTSTTSEMGNIKT